MDTQEFLATVSGSPAGDLAVAQAAFQAARDGVRPTGVWSGAPSLAASTLVMTNTTAWPVEVGVSGGTVTVITKNGVALTAVTSGRVLLQPKATIAITYSVAPTLQWIYS